MRLASFAPFRERHALPPKPPETESLARSPLRARHPLLPNTESKVTTILTAAAVDAASSRVLSLGRSTEGLATTAKPSTTNDPNYDQLYLVVDVEHLADLQKRDCGKQGEIQTWNTI